MWNDYRVGRYDDSPEQRAENVLEMMRNRGFTSMPKWIAERVGMLPPYYNSCGIQYGDWKHNHNRPMPDGRIPIRLAAIMATSRADHIRDIAEKVEEHLVRFADTPGIHDIRYKFDAVFAGPTHRIAICIALLMEQSREGGRLHHSTERAIQRDYGLNDCDVEGGRHWYHTDRTIFYIHGTLHVPRNSGEFDAMYTLAQQYRRTCWMERGVCFAP